MKNYYEILGVSEDASKDNIQKVFRKLALMYHPDVKGGNERKFKEINEAYNILIDDASRSKHDRDLNISPKEKSSFGKSSEPKQSKKESKRYPVENNITLEKWNGFLLSADEVEEYVADGNAVQHSFFADLFSKEKQLDISRRNKRFWELLNKRGVADDPEYFKHHMKAFDEKIVDLIIQPTKKIYTRKIGHMFGGGNDNQFKELIDLIKIEKNESGDLVAYYPISKINDSSGVLFITTKGIAFITVPEPSRKTLTVPMILARTSPIAGVVAGAAIGLHLFIKSRTNTFKLNSSQEVIIKLGIKYSPCFLSHCFKNSQFITFKHIKALIYGDQPDKQQNLVAKIIYNNFVCQDFSMHKEIMQTVINDLSIKNQPTSSVETSNATDLIRKADVLYEQGEYVKVLKICRAIFEFDPDNQKAFEIKSASLLMLAEYEESISTCDDGIELNPINLFLLNTKAVALEKLDRYREAMEIFAEILRVDPKNEQVRLNYEHAKSLIV